MRALTVQQPHADDIMAGRKRFENRSWATKHRGKLLIHSSQRGSGPGVRGAVLGSVEVVGMLTPAQALEKYPDQEPYVFGPVCWELANPQRQQPVKCKGGLGLWNYPRQERDA